MLYVKFNGSKALAVVNEAAMRAAIPASLPPKPSAEALLPFGYAPLAPVPVPAGLVETDTHRYGHTARLADDGRWVREIVLEPVESASIEPRSERKRVEVIAKRDALLAGSDWTQLPDAPVDKAAWASYRKALRDLTDAPGFPWNTPWPTRPVSA